MATRIVDPGHRNRNQEVVRQIRRDFSIGRRIKRARNSEDASTDQKKTAEDHNTKVRRKKMGMTIAYISSHGYQVLFKTIATIVESKRTII